MRLRAMMIVGVILAIIGSTGCAGNSVILNPIDKEDYFSMKKGQTYVAPRDGKFLSDMYVEEIAKIRVGQ